MDTDFCVVDFDIVDHGAEISAAEWDCTILDIVAHVGGEGGDLVLCDPGFRSQLGESAVQRDLGDVPLGFDRGDAVFQSVIGGIGDAVLDGVVKALQARFCLVEVFSEVGDALRVIGTAVCLPFNQASQKLFDALGRQKLIRDAFGDGCVELVHRD